MAQVNKFVPPSDFEKKYLQEHLDLFYIGKQSYHLLAALALHRGLCGPIRLIVQDKKILHSFVELEDDDCYDVSGWSDKTDIEERFCNQATWPAEAIDEQSVLNILSENKLSPELINNHIVKVGLILEALHPKWPWEEPPSMRVEAYLKDLTKLSRQHGIWLVTPSAGPRPQAGFSYEGRAAGYTATLTEAGSGLLLSRL